MCDIADEMIDIHCSFMVGLVNELCSMQSQLKIPGVEHKPGILGAKECQTLIDSVLFLLNLDFDLSVIFNEHEDLLYEEDEESADLPSPSAKRTNEEQKEKQIQTQKMKKAM